MRIGVARAAQRWGCAWISARGAAVGLRVDQRVRLVYARPR
jgi:hypothetical protein